MNDNNVILSKMVKQSQALKSVRGASTIGGKNVAFDFDDQIISSNAYRRAFNSFVNMPPHQLTESDNKHDDDISFLDSGVSSMAFGGDNSAPSSSATHQIREVRSQTIKRKLIPKSFEPPTQISELPENIKNPTKLLQLAAKK